ncbi:SDR family NAD(P)-dependent oxidoreductase [Gracilibacillus alcaliphilus]|uniref:SDR family NAD(P)-dependent oxidoreductase n=1 Tax=Gracilibacillus alcaliphilus TaxID=1401441 RepID=UPI00195C587B|nr:SDR family oxidoreductase [Gracilibacillus alcaliphilus]MBM7675103.1 short-subunit dehydrogenase [Gracilibacillus alcaliphilus]
MNQLQGKHILITGASSGIGEAVAYQVAAQQGTPILIARRIDKLEQISNHIEQTYQIKPIIRTADITDRETWGNILAEMTEEYAIDVLINNAGIGYFNTFADMDWNQIEKMIALNNQALYFTTYAVLPTLCKQPQAHIINIASQAGKIATPKSAVYSATKASVISFSNALRMELAGQVYVTSVNIGPVATEFFDQADPTGDYQRNIARFMLKPDRVANKIVESIFTGKREINMPVLMNTGSKLYQNFPRLVELFGKRLFNQK